MFPLLRILGAELGGRFREYLNREQLSAVVRGVHLRFDPYWSEWFLHWHHWHWGPGYPGWQLGPLPPLEELLKLRPPNWAQHCKDRGYPPDASPVIWLVIVRTPELLRQMEGRLLAVFETGLGTFPIRYEHREAAVALHSPGDSIGSVGPPQTHGTLGGFLEDSVSKQGYVVTCAHVCAAGEVFAHSSAGGTPLGNVIYSVLAPPRTAPGCNSHTHNPPPNLDMALVRVTAVHASSYMIPTVGQPQALSVKVMNTHDRVVLYGAKSKRIEAELDSVGLYHEVVIGGQPHCFGEIFSFTPPRPWYVNTSLVQPGDSGAWITRQSGALILWDGMLIAGDGAHAYGCFSDKILQAGRTQVPNLVLP